jgi:hypothetical protein
VRGRARRDQAAVLAGLEDVDDEVDEPDDAGLDDEDELSEDDPAGLVAGVEDSEDLLSDLSLPPLAAPAGTSEAEPERESVRQKPEPLNTMPTDEKSFRSRPAHSGQSVSGSSVNDCTASRL